LQHGGAQRPGARPHRPSLGNFPSSGEYRFQILLFETLKIRDGGGPAVEAVDARRFLMVAARFTVIGLTFIMFAVWG
jgi:hypothetical protein